MRKESEIVSIICNYLKVKGYFFWRHNNVAIFSKEQKAFRRFPKYCIKGVPDIFVLTPTRTIGLEVKSEVGKQSPEQKAFQEFWVSTLAKREYYVVRSIDDVIGARL